jgi:hypothetical protein
MIMAREAERLTRAEETRRERRMTPGAVLASGEKLSLDETRLDRNLYTYRWVKDEGTRVEILKKRDWDLVDDEAAKTDGTGLGSVPSQIGGVGESGKPYGLVLMKKYRDWHDNDQKLKRKPLDAMEAAIRKGTVQEQAGEPELAGVSYTPGTNALDGPKGADIR